MTNKIKSLIYLSCFILASVVYNSTTDTDSKQEIVAESIEQEADIVVSTFSNNNNDQ